MCVEIHKYLQFVGLLGIAFLFLAGTSLAKEAEEAEIETHVVLMGQNLTCHSCYRSVHGDDCLVMTRPHLDIEHCGPAQNVCMVHYQKTDGELVTFERRCASDCMPGCKTVGTFMTVQHCYSCCGDSDCNTDDLLASGSLGSTRGQSGVVCVAIPLLATLAIYGVS